MDDTRVERFIRQSQSLALVGLPLLWMLMSLLHFRSLHDLLIVRLRYVPRPAADTVNRLMAAHNHAPLLHDQHWIGYLSLPLLVLAAFGLYALGRRVHPLLALLGVSLSVIGCIYLGGVFGLFTALMRGLGEVEPRFGEGAIAVFSAVTADRGAYGLTRALAQLSMLGFALLAASVWRAPRVPLWAPCGVLLGCALFVVFWDLDNFMVLAELCLLAGFVPMSRELRRRATPPRSD